MALIDLFLSRAFKRGQLTVTLPDGTTRTYGEPSADLSPVAIRFVDNSVMRGILRDPGLGAGEAFMDGRLVIERGDVFDFLKLATANSLYEDGTSALNASWGRRLVGRLGHRLATHNARARAKRNVAHHYDLSDRLYDLFLDADRQYSCAYYTGDPATETLEQAQDDKKAHIAAKLALRPGMRVLEIGRAHV